MVGEFGGMNPGICMTESLHCPTEAVIILLISYTPTQSERLKYVLMQQLANIF